MKCAALSNTGVCETFVDIFGDVFADICWFFGDIFVDKFVDKFADFCPLFDEVFGDMFEGLGCSFLAQLIGMLLL